MSKRSGIRLLAVGLLFGLSVISGAQEPTVAGKQADTPPSSPAPSRNPDGPPVRQSADGQFYIRVGYKLDYKPALWTTTQLKADGYRYILPQKLLMMDGQDVILAGFQTRSDGEQALEHLKGLGYQFHSISAGRIVDEWPAPRRFADDEATTTARSGT